MASVPDIQIPVTVSVKLEGIVEGLTVRPGDILVVAFERRLSMQETREMVDRIREIVPGLKVLAFDNGVHLSVLTKQDQEDEQKIPTVLLDKAYHDKTAALRTTGFKHEADARDNYARQQGQRL